MIRPIRPVVGTPLARAGTVIAALAMSGAALAACSSSGGGGSTSSATPTDPTTPATHSAPTGSPAGGKTTAGGARATGSVPTGHGPQLTDCLESQLRASIDPRPVAGTDLASGDNAVIVDFKNTSSRSCLIHGYPGAALVDKSGKQVKQATETIRGKVTGLPPSQHTLPTVTLKPGATASAGIEGVNQQEQGAAQAGCEDSYYPRILVTPPNTSTPVPFTVKWPVCYSFDVHPTNIEKDPPS